MLAVSASAARAQDTTAPAAPPATPPAITLPPATPMPVQIDYSVLANQPFTYYDLEAAKRSGLSDAQVATVAKIATETGQSFSTVRDELLRGATFPSLAVKYGLNLSDLYDVKDEEQTISDYKRAYRTTGTYALKMTSDTGMPYPTADNSATPPAPMTPPVTPSANTTPAAPATMTPASAGDVVDVAMATPRLSTLVKAIQAAGLVDTLKGTGPFTVFAPDNAAFRKLPKGALKALLANPTALANVLEYHVISGQKIDAATAMSMTSPKSPPTVQGGTLNVTTVNGKVMINDATVVEADIQASNGIIHIINKVLMPPAAPADNSGAAPAPAAPMAPAAPAAPTPGQ
jgi:uncharacterized surface protein with fasciclin (FAS1) repeats